MKIQELNQQLDKLEKEKKGTELELAFLEKMREYRGDDEIISFSSYAEWLKSQKEKPKFLTRIPTLDNVLAGINEENLVVITAPTGSGKTTFALTISKNLSESEIPVLWFSWEMSVAEILEKFGDAIPTKCFTPKILLKQGMIWLERKIIEGIAKYDTKIVMIDHLHYLADMGVIGKSHSPSLEFGNIMRQLKLIARKYKIVIFLIAHLKMTEFNEAIKISDLRDSSFVAQEADAVLILWRKTEKQSKREMFEEGVKYTDESILSIAKNRKNGRLQTLKLKLVNGFFKELTS